MAADHLRVWNHLELCFSVIQILMQLHLGNLLCIMTLYPGFGFGIFPGLMAHSEDRVLAAAAAVAVGMVL